MSGRSHSVVFAGLLLVVALVAWAGLPASTLAQTTETFCPPGQTPRFERGFAFLKSQIGAPMGEPIECERADGAGNVSQRTTTGVARWEKATNTMSFTSGGTRWTWTAGGLVRQTVPTAPTPAPPLQLEFTAPVYARSGAQLGTVLVTPSTGAGVALRFTLVGFAPTPAGGSHWVGVVPATTCSPTSFPQTVGAPIAVLQPIQFTAAGTAGAVQTVEVLPAGTLIIRADESAESEIIACASLAASVSAPVSPPAAPTMVATASGAPAPTATMAPPAPTATTAPPTSPTVPPPADQNVQCRTGGAGEICAWVSNDRPPSGEVVTVFGRLLVNGAPAAGQQMTTTWHYASTTADCTGVTDASGVANCSRDIGRATAGYQVNIDVVIGGYSVRTWFTPQ